MYIRDYCSKLRHAIWRLLLRLLHGVGKPKAANDLPAFAIFALPRLTMVLFEAASVDPAFPPEPPLPRYALTQTEQTSLLPQKGCLGTGC